ncbi:unnamed protein product [Effrenium voratum]|nr:unnamed protein product [Effrenium voratum]
MGMSCYRERRKGMRKRKSVRGCIVGPDLAVVHLVMTKKGEADIPGLTDDQKPRRLGPKRASKIRKLFGLEKKDDVRQFVVRRVIKEGKKTKAPKIQRLITPQLLQRKRYFKALTRRRMEAGKVAKAEYQKRLAEYNHEKKEAKAAELQKKKARAASAHERRRSSHRLPKLTEVEWAHLIPVPSIYGRGAVRVAETHRRAITLGQLKDLSQLVGSVLDSLQVQDPNPSTNLGRINLQNVNLYHMNELFVLRLTKKEICSFTELVMDGPQDPAWFVSHWWGTPWRDSLAMLNFHSEVHKLAEASPYWICTFANNQHDLEDSWQLVDLFDSRISSIFGHLLAIREELNTSDLLETPFVRAIMAFLELLNPPEEDVPMEELLAKDEEAILQLVLDEPPEGLYNRWVKERLEYYRRVEPSAPLRDVSIVDQKAPDVLAVANKWASEEFREMDYLIPTINKDRLENFISTQHVKKKSSIHHFEVAAVVQEGRQKITVGEQQVRVPRCPALLQRGDNEEGFIDKVDFEGAWFPNEVACSGVKVDIATANASNEDDKCNILRLIIGETDPSKMPQPPAQHDKYDEVNCAIHRVFAPMAMHDAAQDGNVQEVERLLSAGLVDLAGKPTRNSAGETPLFAACANGRAQMVQLLLEKRADPNLTKSTDGMSPACAAAAGDHEEVLELLLEGKADVNLASTDGGTPLLMAIQAGHYHLVDRLLQAKADPNGAANSQQTPVQFMTLALVHKGGETEEEQHEFEHAYEALERLLKARADPDRVNQGGGSALLAAAVRDSLDALELLLDAKADPNQRDPEYQATVLSWSAHNAYAASSVDAVTALVKNRADVNAVSGEETPLDVAKGMVAAAEEGAQQAAATACYEALKSMGGKEFKELS